MMNDTIEIMVRTQDDLAQLRKVAREILQRLEAPLREQSRISWMIDHFGRQILLFNKGSSIYLTSVEDPTHSHQKGLQMRCEGAWLRSMGNMYKHRLMIPNLHPQDGVKFVDGPDPMLMVTAWLT